LTAAVTRASVVPSRNIVIVRRGEDPAGKTFDIAAFARDVLAALDQGGDARIVTGRLSPAATSL
jgi:hypothetical protein